MRGDAQRALERVGWWPRLAVAAAIGALIPVIGLNSFQFQVGINALLLAILALGLNISVGWAGLLDLGYIAFYGFGAYGSRCSPPTSSTRRLGSTCRPTCRSRW